MSLEEAVAIIIKNPVMVVQINELMPGEWESDKDAENFLIEFAQASLEV